MRHSALKFVKIHHSTSKSIQNNILLQNLLKKRHFASKFVKNMTFCFKINFNNDILPKKNLLGCVTMLLNPLKIRHSPSKSVENTSFYFKICGNITLL